MNFKQYLLTESRDYLSQKVGDVLTGVHELVSAGKQVGTRQLLRHSEAIVNQIRKILHTSWPRSEFKYLKKLQKCGVALMKTIDEKGDLRDTINGVRAELEKVSEKLGMPVNTLGATSKEKPQKQQEPQQEPPPPPPQGQGQEPPPPPPQSPPPPQGQ